MCADSDTKDKALSQLLGIAATRRQSFDDENLRALFSDELVSEVFEAAWAHQWDRENTSFNRAVRGIVHKAVEVVVGDAD